MQIERMPAILGIEQGFAELACPACAFLLRDNAGSDMDEART